VDSFAFEDGYLAVTVNEKTKDEKPVYRLDLSGLYQQKNLVTVLEAVHQLQLIGWKISYGNVSEALQHVKKTTGLHGRWEVILHDPKIILDVAHNVDGISQVVEQLSFETYDHLYIVIGMVKDKEIEEVLKLLPSHASYYFTKAQIPRALDEKELKEKASQLNLDGKAFPDVNGAVQDILTHAKKNDLILICGSVFLVAEVRI
jgi:dihydrofolate synthase/folylpolyglutamate synthase